ncbi:hypothetical protein Aglo03_60100 [Actinokineospora globicatena]|uniref:Uncharacterized protein n=1 Tax=Actinokineospora globicatena TaxID=103729 RepID=A0A9W6VCP9_9PSEU|nr:hypothetical protein Aglo03_60100 [Actinokineospora globicatena]
MVSRHRESTTEMAHRVAVSRCGNNFAPSISDYAACELRQAFAADEFYVGGLAVPGEVPAPRVLLRNCPPGGGVLG